jgi:hypothetical protein
MGVASFRCVKKSDAVREDATLGVSVQDIHMPEGVEGEDGGDEGSECAVSDTVVKAVLQKFTSRSLLGFKKYGTTLDRTDLSDVEWANHLQEELMDAILYVERLKRDLAKRG